jgi:hypothetical protein
MEYPCGPANGGVERRPIAKVPANDVERQTLKRVHAARRTQESPNPMAVLNE